MNTDN
jgi:hypothetical protein